MVKGKLIKPLGNGVCVWGVKETATKKRRKKRSNFPKKCLWAESLSYRARSGGHSANLLFQRSPFWTLSKTQREKEDARGTFSWSAANFQTTPLSSMTAELAASCCKVGKERGGNKRQRGPDGEV